MLLTVFSNSGPVAGDDDHRHTVVDERDRAVLHLGGGLALGVDVADFLELEAPSSANGVLISAAEEQPVLAGAMRCIGGDLVVLVKHCAERPPASGRDAHRTLDQFLRD